MIAYTIYLNGYIAQFGTIFIDDDIQEETFKSNMIEKYKTDDNDVVDVELDY